MRPKILIQKVLAPAIPYLAIGVGILLLQNAWIAIFGYHLGIVLMVRFAGVGVPVRQVFRGRNYRTLLAGVLIGAGGGLLLYLLWPLLAVPDNIDAYLESIGLNVRTWPIFLAYFVTVNPLLEEYYWRGVLGSQRRRPILNDFFFSGYHLLVLAGSVGAVWLPVVFLALAAAGWFWRQINRQASGLLPSVVSHIAGDIAVITTIYFLAT
jgi:hypothetical protein